MGLLWKQLLTRAGNEASAWTFISYGWHEQLLWDKHLVAGDCHGDVASPGAMETGGGGDFRPSTAKHSTVESCGVWGPQRQPEPLKRMAWRLTLTHPHSPLPPPPHAS